MNFTSEEKTAIQRLATAMILADGKVAMEEIAACKFFNSRMGVTADETMAALPVSLEDAISIVAKMNYSQKRLVCAYLGSILAVDKDIDDREMLLWSLLANQCGFPHMTLIEAATIFSKI